MTITMTVDHAGKYVHVRVDGPLTYADIVGHLEAERAAHGLAYPEMIDARGARAEFTPEEARALVSDFRRLAETSSLGPTAIIVDADLTFGMFRMLEILVSDIATIRTFRDETHALQWLKNARTGDQVA